MVKPLVSFVVPCYELGHLLPRCIDSILAQEFRDFEVLVMDNDSQDNTPEVAKSYQDVRIRYIRNETNIGHVANFNKGISLSKGKYLWLMAADDALRGINGLGRFVDILEKHSKVGFVFSRAIELQGNTECGLVRWADCGDEDRIWDGITFLHRLIDANCIVMSSVLARKECYDRISLFPQDIPHAGDWYVWCSFAFHHDVAYCAEPMTFFRVHEESLTSAFNREDTLAGVGDEVNVLLRIDSRVEASGSTSLRRVWSEAIAHRLTQLSRARPIGQPLTETEVDSLLTDRVKNPKHTRDIVSRMGDRQYWAGDYANARRSYWRALKFERSDWKTWAKYLSAFAGRKGAYLRGARRQRSESVPPATPGRGREHNAG
jgi:glycosyltransferase involved in cell wall biosynthesis